MTQLVNKEFNGSLITFDLTSDVMINLTEMARANGKEIKRWLELDSTKSYLSRLKEKSDDGKVDITVIKGNHTDGRTQGTWGSKRVAIRVAQWLSDDFAIWVDDCIDELLTTGSVSLQSKLPQTYLDALKQLVAKEEENQKLLLEIDHKQEVIVELVDSLDLVQKRQILNKVMRRGSDYQERWNSLYSHFNNVYHCNVFLMADRKKCSKLDYVDKHLGKLDKLYEIAVKLFETDVKAVRLQLFPETV